MKIKLKICWYCSFLLPKNLIRITKVIKQEQGSFMLIGEGESDKKSWTRLATYCEQNDLV